MRRKHSFLWKYFSVVDREKGVASCNICGKHFSFKTTTSNLKKHLKRSNHFDHLNLDSDSQQGTSVEFIEVDGFPNDMNNGEDVERELQQVNQQCQLVIEEGVEPQGHSQPEDLLDISNNTFNALQRSAMATEQDIVSVNMDLKQAFQAEIEGIGDLTEADFGGKIDTIPTPDPAPIVQRELPRMHRQSEYRLHTSSKPVHRVTSSLNQSPAVDSSSKDVTDNEFDLFGKYIGKQLRKLSKVNSFLAQDEIQSILTRYRIYETMSGSRRSSINSDK
ncbi:uncharacterized protein LOC111044304 [Nilaparvata lugens]|uniref:uncharacterized protein LOC111044304 n=1 Tax=Nilaparvata lugens TaxID=108931 RepID=UPI00193E73C9|nr:uncharacterized protein LOC111044304 [Nilaparvata lugens]